MKPSVHPEIYIGDAAQKRPAQTVKGEYLLMLGDLFYKIQRYDAMEPFFMSIISSSDHWMFIATTGGLSAGRVSAEQALFPYYTVDKLTENSEQTGSKTILLATRSGRTSLWEPFSERQRGAYVLERNLYKNTAGTTVVFEEINHSLELSFRCAWRTSDAFGFVKTGWLSNHGQSACQVELVDGVQNILPANIASGTQHIFSSLLDAYKRSELDQDTGLGIFTLNSTLTDLAEPSESLLATTVVQVGLDPLGCLLSAHQLDAFRAGLGLEHETEIRGQRCAYFAHALIDLEPGAEKKWHLLAEVGQDSAAIVRLKQTLLETPFDRLQTALENDIALNQANLNRIVAQADGLQLTKNQPVSVHHFANVMFNVMRGGIFADQYTLQTRDFVDFAAGRNRQIQAEQPDFFAALPAELSLGDLLTRAEGSGSADILRLSYAYLPLCFSRRHGDPSRPWNRFAIDIKRPDGSLQLGYEGNWRDIFQNWEALAFAFPDYIESMISIFLDATTPDGYNPYRITHHGIDWEAPEPNNPWANIGYWSDHQIIYLQKLMEISDRVHPGKLHEFLTRPAFSYANVPYQIKPYADLVQEPNNSIAFNWELENSIHERVKSIGSDGKLILSHSGRVVHANLTEKLLTLVLAKLSNFVPEGGIWMNTQRPEWNDANNALVGKGLSVVTLCYLRRFVAFCKDLFQQSGLNLIPVSAEVAAFFAQTVLILDQFKGELQGSFSGQQRLAMLDALGQAGGEFRGRFYANGFSGELANLTTAELVNFLDLALGYIEHTLRANRRPDALYHAYNILHRKADQVLVTNLVEMLEGQVAVLSSGMLSGAESLALLDSLRHSQLYRADQHTYILYPDRVLPGFLAKNKITPEQVSGLALVAELERRQDKTLFVRDLEGNYHFNGQVRNVKDVVRRLQALADRPGLAGLVEAEKAQVEALFEQIFRHDEFTGRSGTFFGYEGLGSIYWHMVSKLLLAVQETILRTRTEPGLAALMENIRISGWGSALIKLQMNTALSQPIPIHTRPKARAPNSPG